MKNNKLLILGFICSFAAFFIALWVDISFTNEKFAKWLNISQNLLIAGVLLIALWTILKLRK